MSQANQFSSQFSHDSSQSIGFIFMKTYSAWHNAIKTSLKQHNITHPQFIVLATLGYLSQQPIEINQVMLAQHANMDVMTVSKVLEKLEKKLFIQRKTAKKDSRAKCIALTQSGYQIVNTTVPQIEMVDEQFFSRLGCDIDNFRQNLLTLLK